MDCKLLSLDGMVRSAWDGNGTGERKRTYVTTYCIVLLCSLLAGCACVFTYHCLVFHVFGGSLVEGRGKGWRLELFKYVV